MDLREDAPKPRNQEKKKRPLTRQRAQQEFAQRNTCSTDVCQAMYTNEKGIGISAIGASKLQPNSFLISTGIKMFSGEPFNFNSLSIEH